MFKLNFFFFFFSLALLRRARTFREIRFHLFLLVDLFLFSYSFLGSTRTKDETSRMAIDASVYIHMIGHGLFVFLYPILQTISSYTPDTPAILVICTSLHRSNHQFSLHRPAPRTGRFSDHSRIHSCKA